MQETILLVDDDIQVLAGLERTLYTEGYSILTAGDAEKALEVLAKERIDVIICDEQMPGACGSELLTFARKRYPDSIRIMLTGKANIASAARAVQNGQVFKFLEKPCPGPKVVGAIREALLKRAVSRVRGETLSMSQREQCDVMKKVAEDERERRRRHAESK